MPWGKIMIPMRDVICEGGADHLNRSDIGAPGLPRLSAQAAAPYPFNGFFLTRIREHKIADCKGADIPLSSGRSDQRAAKETVGSAAASRCSAPAAVAMPVSVTAVSIHSPRPECCGHN